MSRMNANNTYYHGFSEFNTGIDSANYITKLPIILAGHESLH